MTGYQRGVRRAYYNGRLYVVSRGYYREVTPGRFAFSFASKGEQGWFRRSDIVWGQAR